MTDFYELIRFYYLKKKEQKKCDLFDLDKSVFLPVFNPGTEALFKVQF